MAEIDAEIARLETVRNLLAGIEGSPDSVRRRKARVDEQARSSPRRKLSAEARERIRQAQIKRWAASKQSTGPKVPAKKAAGAKPRRARTIASRAHKKQRAGTPPAEIAAGASK